MYGTKNLFSELHFAVFIKLLFSILFAGYELTDNILRTITVLDYFDCVTACLAEQRCCSVNYKPDGIPICDLNKRCRRKRVKDGCMKPRTYNVVYYELSDTKGRGLVSKGSLISYSTLLLSILEFGLGRVLILATLETLVRCSKLHNN